MPSNIRYLKAVLPVAGVVTRGSVKPLAFAWMDTRARQVRWASRRDLIPAGAPFAAAVEISLREYRAILDAKRAEA